MLKMQREHAVGDGTERELHGKGGCGESNEVETTFKFGE